MKKYILGIAFLMLLGFYFAGNSSIKNKGENSEDYPVWIDMMEAPSVNMEEARKAFDTYWNHNTHYKGDRSKQFERWYVRNAKRLDQYGNVISSEQVINEFQRLRKAAAFTQVGQWYNYGPILVGARKNGDKRDGGRVKHIEFHPTDANTYYISCFKSGLFKTTDAGASWTPLTDDLPNDVRISKVLPSSPNTIFIGTKTGMLKSTDGGLNWNSLGSPSGATNALLIKPDNENIIIAGNVSGIYRSTNGGNSFSLVKSASKVEELRVHPSNPNIMYASTNGSRSQFFRSVDGGATWTENTADFGRGAFMKIAMTPAAPNNVYVINSRDHLDQDSFEGFYVSTNSGVSFTKKSSGTPCITGYKDDGSISRGQPNYNLFVTVDPVNTNLIYAGGVKSWKSTDGGVNWTQAFNNVTTYGFGLHLDQLTWAHSPINNKLFAVNDGGIYFVNTNNKFQSITDGLPIAEVFECTQSQTNKTNVAGGTMHNGIKVNKNGTWYTPWGGDEATIIFDYSDDTYVYSIKYDKVNRSIDGGFTFQRIKAIPSDKGEYTGTGVLDKSDVNTLFVGLFEVERINNARTATSSQVWDKISSFGGSTKIKKIEQSDADHNVLYVSRGNGSFYRSDNVRAVNPTFTNLSGNLPGSGTINDIATHPTDPNFVYILRGNQFYKSTDKGVTWTNISSGLPGVALSEMVYDKSSNEGIYIGTDIGVYYKDASLSSWIDYSNKLPAIRISGMDIYYGATRDESVLTVSTDGRGFWRSALNDVVATAATANFSSDIQNVFVGNAVNFTDTSTGSPITWEWTFEEGSPSNSYNQNPSVVYNSVGTFKVTLKATSLGGSNVIEKVNYITVTNANGSGNLQGHYNFQSNLNDDSSYARGLSVVGGFTPTYVNDHNNNPNSAYQSPGVSGKYLTTSSYKGIGANGERTVTAWIKTTTAGSRKTIVSWGTNSPGQMFNVMIENGNIRVEGGGANVQNDNTSVARLDGNTWRHIAVTYNPVDGDKLSNVKLYIDGVYYANQPDSGSSYNSQTTVINTDNATNNVLIGNASYTANYFWRGELDDVRIYSKALTVSEINAVMGGTTLGLNNATLKDKIKVYPNPVTDMLTIKTSVAETLKVSIYSVLGTLVMTKSTQNPTGKMVLNMSHLPSGSYFVILNTNGQHAGLKIIKN